LFGLLGFPEGWVGSFGWGGLGIWAVFVIFGCLTVDFGGGVGNIYFCMSYGYAVFSMCVFWRVVGCCCLGGSG
jgi:hypothetical protein